MCMLLKCLVCVGSGTYLFILGSLPMMLIRCCEQIGVFNAMMLIRFVFSAHRLWFLMLLRFVALDWVPILFLNATQIGVLNVIYPNGIH